MSARKFRLTEHITPEHEAQIDCTKMLERVLLPGVQWTAIDHANAKDGLTGAIRKARGVRAGIPDYLFWHRSKSYAIEFKAKDGVVSEPQKLFLQGLTDAEVECAVCWGQTQVFDRVHAWGLTRKMTVMT